MQSFIKSILKDISVPLYLNQLPQLQILLNICMISRAFFLFIYLLSYKQTEMQMAKHSLEKKE